MMTTAMMMPSAMIMVLVMVQCYYGTDVATNKQRTVIITAARMNIRVLHS